jgi:hypothetical protein
MHLSPEYQTWMAMRGRCLNPNDPSYERYGGRGITIVWESFESFLHDMGYRPSLAHSIDRIDVNGPYSKENCRWSTPQEQARNRRNTIMVVFQGKKMSLSEAADLLGIPRDTARYRYYRGQFP